jgi:hypothetical protein
MFVCFFSGTAGIVCEGGGLVVELKKSYILKSLKNKLEVGRNRSFKERSIMLSFKEHAKKFNLDEEEQEILADFEANHAGKTQIPEERKKELASLANASSRDEIMLNTMQQLSADAARSGSSKMSLGEINVEIGAARDGLINQEKKKSFSLHPYKKLYFKSK